MPKPVIFLGNSLAAVRSFPDGPRRETGFQLDRIQRGLEPDHWRAMPAIGFGVKEIRVADPAGAFRTIYVATVAGAVYVWHAFQKKTRATPAPVIATARRRYKELMREARQ